ncbi:MAG: phosphoenolpyruvate--protein phosphotransferase [Clostridia bacterium]|nr:phosphoenolpyruvate--protein phosphotransferase [Clostridia bacterium]
MDEKMITLRGKPVMEGIAIGILRFSEAAERSAEDADPCDGSAEARKDRFFRLRDEVAAECDALARQARAEVGAAEAEIFTTHRLMVLDGDLEDAVLAGIEAGLGLAEAIRQAGKGLSAMLAGMEDDYLRARAADAKDVCDRLIATLRGEGQPGDGRLDVPTVLAATDITPAQLLRADRSLLMGFFTADGATGSHTAILARSLSLPSAVAVGALPDRSLEGETVIVDGFTGEIIVAPDTRTLALYCEKQAAFKAERQLEETFRGLADCTADGYQIQVVCNIGRGEEAASVLQNDGGGVGLFRSEFLYLESSDYPTEETQYRVYRRLLEDMGGRPVVIRTMDVGADKQVGYFGIGREENPALGYRSIRICMDRPEILTTQLRALYRASVFGKLSILVPMIISPSELSWVRRLSEEVRDELRAEGIAYDPCVPLGIMIETPAAALISDLLAQDADFFSIGTNDLTQYSLAVDRQNPRIERLYDAHHPAILRMIAAVAENAHRAGKKVSVCGELARDTSLTPFFLAVGVDSLSVSPPYVLRLRRAIRECDRSRVKIEEFLNT